jgi:hypothetical protein
LQRIVLGRRDFLEKRRPPERLDFSV